MATYPNNPRLSPTYGRPISSPGQQSGAFNPGYPSPYETSINVPTRVNRDFTNLPAGPPSYVAGQNYEKPGNQIGYTSLPQPAPPFVRPGNSGSIGYTNLPQPAAPPGFGGLNPPRQDFINSPQPGALPTNGNQYIPRAATSIIPPTGSTPYQEPINMRSPVSGGGGGFAEPSLPTTAPPPFVLDQLQQPAQPTLDSQFSQFQGSQSPGKGGGLSALQRFSAAQGGYSQPAYGQYNPSPYSPPAYGQAGGKGGSYGGSGGTFGNSGKGG